MTSRRSPRSRSASLVIAASLLALGAAAHADTSADRQRNFAGSVQLDYMSVPSQARARDEALDGATVELSLKLAMDFGEHTSSNVKVCVACHGLEVGMAFFDLRVNDELNFRVGRFTPAFGEFPLRHDPANHRTSDKPLPYDMGRMLHLQDWNLGVLPAPWVDNGLEINGTHFFDEIVQVDYAAYAVGGPRAPSDSLDFDFKQSRSAENYYIDNNSHPVLGGHLAWSINADPVSFQLGASGMTGTYDNDNKLRFSVLGAQAILHIDKAVVRAEYLVRRTEMALGDDPAARFRYGPGADGKFDPYFLKEGFYTEAEVPIGKFDLVARWDGLRRRGNVAKMSELRSDTGLLRYTLGGTFLLRESLRLKVSGEFYDFSDFGDDKVIHVGIAGPF
ncbi:MAG: OprO/OprP family phosphate-selective porin [Deltaproteobacteria bacterium]|nr:OprO/OprP family phosphate-selective porin [Deltaproteobacteria bacterium]